ncbi:uncharacterized protein LOC144097791 [Amblyomma americanum]
MAAYSDAFAAEPPRDGKCNCPAEAAFDGPEQQHSDAALDLPVATARINTGSGSGGGGNTLVSIPIPISVPLPLSQSSGASGGPIIITSPPPPAPPNPPQPPHPPAPRPGIAQDLASMLMMLVMNHVRERVEGTPAPGNNEEQRRDVDIAAAAAAAAAEAVANVQPKESMVPLSVVRQMMRQNQSKDTAAIERKERRLRRKSIAAVLADLPPPVTPQPPFAPPPPAPPLVLPFQVPEPAAEAPEAPVQLPPVQPHKPPKPPESLSTSPEEETASGTFRAQVPCCDRCCCYMLVLAMLATVLAVNLAFLIAPKEVTAFFCELGLEEPLKALENIKGVSTLSARLGAEIDNNESDAGPILTRVRVGLRASGESVFAIEEPPFEEPSLPAGDVFGTEEPSTAANNAGRSPLPDNEEPRTGTRKQCFSGEEN